MQANEDAPWELFYWAPVNKETGKIGMMGRGEFVRIMFEVAGVPFIDSFTLPDGGPQTLNMMWRKGGHSDMPCFAPPIIRKGDFVLNQTPAIMKYLGKEFGFYPTNKADEAHADALIGFITDVIAEGRLVFHARCFTESYYTQKEETAGHIKCYEETRLPSFLGYLETVLAHNAKKHSKGFAIGETMTYVDLSLWHTLEAATSQFPESYPKIVEDKPLLRAFREQIAAIPRLAAYLQSDRRGHFEGNSMM